MSGNLGELTVKFTGDASSLSSTISKVQSELSGMNAMSQKGVKSIAEQTRQMGGYDKIVAKSAESLKQKRSILAETEKAYKQNTKQLNENIKGLNGQKSAIGSLMTSKKAEIQALESANAGLNKNSQAYKDNVKAIQWTQNEYKGLQKQHDEVSKSILSNESALKRESAAYNSAKSAVSNASKQYESLAQNQKAIVNMEKALNLQDVGESWQKAGQSINAITKPIQLASVALAAGGVASAKFAIDFEDNFANVKKTVDGTPQQLQEVRQGIIDLSTTGIDGRNAIPQTTAQLTELAAAGGQLGIKTENIVGFTETMAQMGTATNLAGEQGAKTLARFMNVAGVSQDQVGNLGSSIVDLGNNFATTEAEIADMAMYMGSTGANVGISAQDVLAYSTALSSLGAEAASGGSAVSRIWMQMHQSVAEGGEDLETFAELSGKSSEEFKEQWNTDASGAFQDFLKGLSKTDDQISTLSNLGFNNIRDLQALQKLAGSSGIDLLADALEHSNTAWAEGTALQKEFNAKAETTASQVQITKNNLVEAARGIGETFLPTIKNVSGGIKDFAQNIANMSDDSKQRLINIGTGLIGMGAGAKVIAGTTKGIGNFVESLGKLGTVAPTVASVGRISLAAAAGIIAVTGAVALGTAAYHAYQNTQIDVVKVTGKLVQATKDSLKEYNKIQGYKTQAQQLEATIKTSTDTKEIEKAQKKLDELKAQVEQEYNVEITVNDNGFGGEFDKIEGKAKSDLLSNRADLQNQLNDSDFSKAIKNTEDFSSGLKEAENDVQRYSSALGEYKDLTSSFESAQKNLNEQFQSGSIDAEQYNNKMSELQKNYSSAQEKVRNAYGVSANDPVAGWLLDAERRVSEFSSKLDKSEAEVQQYKEGIQGVADVTSALVPKQLADGEFERALSGINTTLGDVKNYTKEMGYDDFARGITEQLTVAQQGLDNIYQVAQGSTEGIGNFFSDFVSNAELAGASSDDIAKSMANIGTSLMQNGADGNVVADIINSLNELPEDKTVAINAEGNGLEVIDKIGKEPVTQEVNQEVNEAETPEPEPVTQEVEQEVEPAPTEEPEPVTQEVQQEVEEAPTESPEPVTQEVKQEVEEAPNADLEPVTQTINLEVGEVPTPDNLVVKGKVDYELGTMPQVEPPTITGTANYNLGITPTSVPEVLGTANYNLGTAPTSAPDISGVANYKGNFPSSAPTLHGTVVYKAEIQGAPKAKGDKNFPGGMAMINDEKGTSDPRELVEYGGRGYIFEGRDVVLPLPEHAKIYTAKQTKQIMSGAGIPRYASGKNNEDWENAKSDREHIRKTSYNIIPAWEELEWLDQMKQKFASDAEVIKEIEEEIVNYTREMWSQNLESMEFALDMGWTSQEEYYNNLAVYRDENFAPDTQEWKDATLKLHKYSQQLIDDANAASKAYIDLHASINDWGEMGTSMGAVWQTVNQRNVQAAKDGLITWEDYFDTRLDYTEQFLDGYLDYSDDWIDNEKEYNNMSAADTIAAVNRQRKEVEEYFAGLGELTDEEKVVRIKVEAELDKKMYDAVRDKLSEWEDDADWTEKQAGVYGWEEIGENKLDFYQRKIDKYTQWSQDESLDPTKQQYARRQADEMKMKLYEATEDRYDEMLDMAKDRMDEVKDLLDDKLSALEESWEVEDRAEDKAETLSDIEKYKNAVTIEGKQKYQEALDKLKEIERDEQRYQIEQENNAIIKQMEAEYKALEDEKANILQQTKEANLKVASVVEPLEQSINANMDNMASRIEAAIKEIKPSITVTQNITSNINDGTDGILYHNKVLSKTVTAVGGQK